MSKEIIPHADLIRAVLDGKEVEYKPIENDPWDGFCDAMSTISTLVYYPHWQYRLKAEPEPHVLNGHYRDHVDSVNGFSLSQLEEYGDARAAHARKQALGEAADMLAADAKVIELLERISKAESYKGGAWQKVIIEAKKYAMMNLNGSYVVQRNGQDCIIKIRPGERDTYLKLFSDNMLTYSLEAAAEEIMGI